MHTQKAAAAQCDQLRTDQKRLSSLSLISEVLGMKAASVLARHLARRVCTPSANAEDSLKPSLDRQIYFDAKFPLVCDI